jgi:large subunit ribosomal protein L20
MRVKRGVVSRRRHKKLIKKAEGYRGRSKNVYKVAKTRVQKALQYAFRDRRAKKRTFRTLWIARMNAAVREQGMTYGRFIFCLKKANIELDRRVLAELAVHQPKLFAAVVEKAKAAA